MLNRSRALLSMPIISLEEGRQIGKIRGVVVDPRNFSIAAVVTDKQSWFGEYKIIPYEHVMSIGDHAVTIDKKNNIEKPANLPEISALMKDSPPLLGGKVFSEDGTLLGIVEEFVFNAETGEIKSLEVTGRFIDSFLRGRTSLSISTVLTIGADAIIVRNHSEDEISRIDSPLKKKMRDLSSTGKKLLGSTRKKTKKLGDSLNDSLDRFTGGDENTDENDEK